MSQLTQLVRDRTKINPVFCRTQPRPHSGWRVAEAAGFERQPQCPHPGAHLPLLVALCRAAPPGLFPAAPLLVSRWSSLGACPLPQRFGVAQDWESRERHLPRPRGPRGRAQASSPLHLLLSAALGLPGGRCGARYLGLCVIWASASPGAVPEWVSRAAAQAESCNWRSLQHRLSRRPGP